MSPAAYESSLLSNLNVLPVWELGINGTGITVSILDDGVDYLHPGLAKAWSSEGSWDFASKGPQALPQKPDDRHGTRCAGQIAAALGSKCGPGVAFGAQISAERLLGEGIFDSTEAKALNYRWERNDIYSSSWGPADDGSSLDGPGRFAQAALESGIRNGRHGRGSIFVFANGNGGKADNCNYDGYASSIYTISVGAITHDGVLTPYSEPCAAHLAVSYAGGHGKVISTTDPRGRCTTEHTGTSAAAPYASGVIALLLSYRPDLTWRDVQHLIIHSAKITDPGDPGWRTNGAGLPVSHKYGYGAVDAYRLIEAARDFRSLPEAMPHWKHRVRVHRRIPAAVGRHAALIDEIRVRPDRSNMISRLEHVQVVLRLVHPKRRFLTISLVSPAGTESILGTPRPRDTSDQGFNPWTFTTVHHWGESPLGRWQLRLADRRDDDGAFDPRWPDEGTLISWELVLAGIGNASAADGDWTISPRPHAATYDLPRPSFLSVGTTTTAALLLVPIVLAILYRRPGRRIYS
ncbi:the Pro protein Convertase Furin [Polychytrium aggregatum]|uniref:the Pro protein Convertase Furin n=1 Tax=Polychytrium aggregatum TaxID=110093 RepID=UPI0022FE14AB|nr:the Pro protein Convertase Furin [Polychytrium aggregatum]KAI9206671.1 the Pro protein Convertase Furin [Polychytrium aggregatum]